MSRSMPVSFLILRIFKRTWANPLFAGGSGNSHQGFMHKPTSEPGLWYPKQALSFHENSRFVWDIIAQARWWEAAQTPDAKPANNGFLFIFTSCPFPSWFSTIFNRLTYVLMHFQIRKEAELARTRSQLYRKLWCSATVHFSQNDARYNEKQRENTESTKKPLFRQTQNRRAARAIQALPRLLTKYI